MPQTMDDDWLPWRPAPASEHGSTERVGFIPDEQGSHLGKCRSVVTESARGSHSTDLVAEPDARPTETVGHRASEVGLASADRPREHKDCGGHKPSVA